MKSVEGGGVSVLMVVSFPFVYLHVASSSTTPVYGRFRVSGIRPGVHAGLGKCHAVALSTPFTGFVLILRNALQPIKHVSARVMLLLISDVGVPRQVEIDLAVVIVAHGTQRRPVNGPDNSVRHLLPTRRKRRAYYRLRGKGRKRPYESVSFSPSRSEY